MKMKMRVLTVTNKGKLLALAKMVADEYSNYASDVIPPAYPCETERLVIIFLTGAAKYSSTVEIFCKNLNKNTAQNVALVVDGDMEKAQPIIDMIKGAGCNFCEEILTINGGLPFKFLKKVTDAEKQTVMEWVERTIKSFKS